MNGDWMDYWLEKRVTTPDGTGTVKGCIQSEICPRVLQVQLDSANEQQGVTNYKLSDCKEVI